MFWSESKKNNSNNKGELALDRAVQLESSKSSLRVGVPQNLSTSKNLGASKISKNKSSQFIFENFGSVALGLSKSLELSTDNIKFDVPVLIAGKFTGELIGRDSVIISETAEVEGLIEVKNLYVFGKLNGDVRVLNLFQLFPGASFYGTLNCKSSNISKDSKFNAKCVIGENLYAPKADFEHHLNMKADTKKVKRIRRKRKQEQKTQYSLSA